jgi:hypothetical protein
MLSAAKKPSTKPAPRQASSTAAALKAACSKGTRSVKRGPHIDPHGFDAGRLIKGKKRHVLVNTQGLLLHGLVTAAAVQDRDEGLLLLLLATLFDLFPFLKKLFADRRAHHRFAQPLPANG